MSDTGQEATRHGALLFSPEWRAYQDNIDAQIQTLSLETAVDRILTEPKTTGDVPLCHLYDLLSKLNSQLGVTSKSLSQAELVDAYRYPTIKLNNELLMALRQRKEYFDMVFMTSRGSIYFVTGGYSLRFKTPRRLTEHFSKLPVDHVHRLQPVTCIYFVDDKQGEVIDNTMSTNKYYWGQTLLGRDQGLIRIVEPQIGARPIEFPLKDVTRYQDVIQTRKGNTDYVQLLEANGGGFASGMHLGTPITEFL